MRRAVTALGRSGVVLLLAACPSEPPPASAVPQAVERVAPPAPDPVPPTEEPTESPPSPDDLPVAEPPPPSSARPARPAARSKPVAYEISSGTVSFLIDAPLEKIKGTWTGLSGTVRIDPTNLRATRGKLTLDLTGLRVSTFDDPGKNTRQQEHALNWLEVSRHAVATFALERVTADPGAFAAGTTRARAQVAGTVTLHGVAAATTAHLVLTFEGPADAPTSVRVRTARPLRVSLEHHSVEPRDLAGKFLAGALERIGQKIDDQVQVSLDFTLKRAQ